MVFNKLDSGDMLCKIVPGERSEEPATREESKETVSPAKSPPASPIPPEKTPAGGASASSNPKAATKAKAKSFRRGSTSSFRSSGAVLRRGSTGNLAPRVSSNSASPTVVRRGLNPKKKFARTDSCLGGRPETMEDGGGRLTEKPPLPDFRKSTGPHPKAKAAPRASTSTGADAIASTGKSPGSSKDRKAGSKEAVKDEVIPSVASNAVPAPLLLPIPKSGGDQKEGTGALSPLQSAAIVRKIRRSGRGKNKGAKMFVILKSDIPFCILDLGLCDRHSRGLWEAVPDLLDVF